MSRTVLTDIYGGCNVLYTTCGNYILVKKITRIETQDHHNEKKLFDKLRGDIRFIAHYEDNSEYEVSSEINRELYGRKDITVEQFFTSVLETWSEI